MFSGRNRSNPLQKTLYGTFDLLSSGHQFFRLRHDLIYVNIFIQNDYLQFSLRLSICPNRQFKSLTLTEKVLDCGGPRSYYDLHGHMLKMK